jgi:galactonate dehydratase
MKITDIKTAEVRGHGYSCYARVFTDEGITGTGECIHGGDGVRLLIAGMKSLLAGENPLDVDRLFEKVRRSHIFNGALAGNMVTAITGVEIALWDLAGKALGVPIYRLLGGQFRDRIRLYCDCGLGREERPEAGAQKAKEVVGEGFTALKFDIDDLRHPLKHDSWNHTLNNGELDAMVDKVAAVREAIGPHVDLAIDMHGRYDTRSGIRVAQALEPFRLLWLEEPVPPENVDAMLEVKRSTRTPICAGENLYLRYGFRDLIEKQAVDIIMPDIPKCCGLSEGRKIANLAEIYYIPMAPHNVCGPLGTLASCHTCASIPNFLVLEWHWRERPHWNTLLQTSEPIIQNGYIRVPDTPGIGAELNEEVAREYARPDAPFFE